jgi:hypothetical protein
VTSSWTCGSGLRIHFAAGLRLRLALSHTHIAQYSTQLPEPERHGFTPKGSYRGVLLRVDQTPLLPPEADLNSNPGSYSLMSGAPKLIPKPFRVPLCDQNSPSLFAGREAPSPLINTSGGAWQGQPSKEARDAEPATRR